MVGINRGLIIAVEDDNDLRTLWKIKLEQSGVNSLVLDTNEALQLPPYRWKQADVLITDWMLGSVTGADIIEVARQHHPDIDCHILTAVGETIKDQKPERAQVWYKPLSIDAIIRESRYAG